MRVARSFEGRFSFKPPMSAINLGNVTTASTPDTKIPLHRAHVLPLAPAIDVEVTIQFERRPPRRARKRYQPCTSHAPAMHQPLTSHSPAIHQPLPTHTKKPPSFCDKRERELTYIHARAYACMLTHACMHAHTLAAESASPTSFAIGIADVFEAKTACASEPALSLEPLSQPSAFRTGCATETNARGHAHSIVRKPCPHACDRLIGMHVTRSVPWVWQP
jgi:hypothetical protein